MVAGAKLHNDHHDEAYDVGGNDDEDVSSDEEQQQPNRIMGMGQPFNATLQVLPPSFLQLFSAPPPPALDWLWRPWDSLDNLWRHLTAPCWTHGPMDAEAPLC